MQTQIQSKSFKVEVRFVDSKTGEICFTGCKICTMFCHGDGEGYLQKLIFSFMRGLRSKDNLCIEIVCNRVEVESVPFPNLF